MPRTPHKLYQVFDTVAEVVLGPIMVALNDQVASRDFARWIMSGELKMAPEDFRLLRLGTMDDFGSITPEEPTVVITGAQVLATLKSRSDA